jgi:hypothetical protein
MLKEDLMEIYRITGCGLKAHPVIQYKPTEYKALSL